MKSNITYIRGEEYFSNDNFPSNNLEDQFFDRIMCEAIIDAAITMENNYHGK